MPSHRTRVLAALAAAILSLTACDNGSAPSADAADPVADTATPTSPTTTDSNDPSATDDGAAATSQGSSSSGLSATGLSDTVSGETCADNAGPIAGSSVTRPMNVTLEEGTSLFEVPFVFTGGQLQVTATRVDGEPTGPDDLVKVDVTIPETNTTFTRGVAGVDVAHLDADLAGGRYTIHASGSPELDVQVTVSTDPSASRDPAQGANATSIFLPFSATGDGSGLTEARISVRAPSNGDIGSGFPLGVYASADGASNVSIELLAPDGTSMGTSSGQTAATLVHYVVSGRIFDAVITTDGDAITGHAYRACGG